MKHLPKQILLQILHMKSIKNLLQILLASSFLIFFLYKRVKVISNTSLEFNIIYKTPTIMILFMILLFITLSLLIIRQMLNKKNKSDVTKKIVIFIEKYYYQPLRNLDDFIQQKLKYYMHFNRRTTMAKLCDHLIITILHKKSINIFHPYLIIYIILKNIPSLIVSVTFLHDIIYYKQLYYFYLSLPLLIISLMLEYLKYICFLEDYTKVISILRNKLQIMDIHQPKNTDTFAILSVDQYLDRIIFYYLRKENHPYKETILSYEYFKNRTDAQRKQNLDYKKICQHYTRYLRSAESLHILLWMIKNIENQLLPYIRLITYLVYLISWIYILMHKPPFFTNILDIFTIFHKIEEPFSGLDCYFTKI